MRSLQKHGDVAAYALGVLDEAEAFRFEDHLMECPRCTTQVAEFGPVTRQLMLYRNATPRSVHPMAAPGGRLLDRCLREVAARSRVRRRRLLYAVAAVVVLAVAGPVIAATAGGGDGALSVEAADERSGVWARVTAQAEPWGSHVALVVKDAAGPRVCRLIAIGRDGSEETVTTWTASPRDARPTSTHGGAALRPDETARYEVRTTAGERLVSIPTR